MEVYRIISQNSSAKDIEKYIHRNIILKKYKTSIDLSKDKIIHDKVISLIQSGYPKIEMDNLERINLHLGDCLIGIRDKHRHRTIYDNPIYLLPGIYNDLPLICGYCWQSICKFSEQICVKMGKVEYKARRKKSLLFRKSEICNLIDNDILIYIYKILIFKI